MPFLTLQYQAWMLEVKFGRSLGKQIQESDAPGLKSGSATVCLGDVGQLLYSSCPSVPSFVKWDTQVYLPARVRNSMWTPLSVIMDAQ